MIVSFLHHPVGGLSVRLHIKFIKTCVDFSSINREDLAKLFLFLFARRFMMGITRKN